MYGAILGDMVGSPYEFDMGNKSKDFEMWNRRVRFTDDTVMTIVVADAIMSAGVDSEEKETNRTLNFQHNSVEFFQSLIRVRSKNCISKSFTK